MLSELKRQAVEAVARVIRKHAGHQWGDGEEAWLVYFEDNYHRPELFTGRGAEVGAKARFLDARQAWSCHLFRAVAWNLSNDVMPTFTRDASGTLAAEWIGRLQERNGATVEHIVQAAANAESLLMGQSIADTVGCTRASCGRRPHPRSEPCRDEDCRGCLWEVKHANDRVRHATWCPHDPTISERTAEVRRQQLMPMGPVTQVVTHHPIPFDVPAFFSALVTEAIAKGIGADKVRYCTRCGTDAPEHAARALACNEPLWRTAAPSWFDTHARFALATNACGQCGAPRFRNVHCDEGCKDEIGHGLIEGCHTYVETVRPFDLPPLVIEGGAA